MTANEAPRNSDVKHDFEASSKVAGNFPLNQLDVFTQAGGLTVRSKDPRALKPAQAKDLLVELHSSICGLTASLIAPSAKHRKEITNCMNALEDCLSRKARDFAKAPLKRGDPDVAISMGFAQQMNRYCSLISAVAAQIARGDPEGVEE